MSEDSTQHKKKTSSRFTRILIAFGGFVVLSAILIAVLNTYTDVFEEVIEPKQRKQPKKTIDYAKPKDVSNNTPAKKFTDEVMEAYPNLIKVSAQITLGSTCTAQLYVSVSTFNQFNANADRTENILTDIREKAVKHAHSPTCRIEVFFKKKVVFRATPKMGKTVVQKIKT